MGRNRGPVSEATMIGAKITGETFTLKQLFERATYRIDFYQREYAWTADDVSTLISDLFEQFEAAWRDGRTNRRNPQEPFFLGPFVYADTLPRHGSLPNGPRPCRALLLILIHL